MLTTTVGIERRRTVWGLGQVRAAGMIGAMGLASTLACTNTNIPDLNYSSVAGFQAAPTQTGAQALFDAMLAGERDETALFIRAGGQFGREAYDLCVSCGSLP